MFNQPVRKDFQNSDAKTQNNEGTHYLDLQSLLEDRDLQANCVQCESLTKTQCKQCSANLCKKCFYITHKDFVIFKQHVLQHIEQQANLNNCKIHQEKQLDYYCKDCNKTLCLDCMIVRGENSCQKHEVVTMTDMTEIFVEELGEILPKITEAFKRLTKTAVDIGTLLYNIDSGLDPKCDLTKVIVDTDHYFFKLIAEINKKQQEVNEVLEEQKRTERQSLMDAKKEIANHIKETCRVIKAIETCLDPNTFKQVNLLLLLEEAKAAAKVPWYLKKEDTKGKPLKIVVYEDLCMLVSKYVQVEGTNSAYKLYSPSELGDIELPPPPDAPVYPPALPKDVKITNKPKKVVEADKEAQKAILLESPPRYRGKSSPISSLDSIESNTFFRSYVTRSGASQNPKDHSVRSLRKGEYPEAIKEGSLQFVYLSHIVDPRQFYVQRACHQGIFKDMLREFKNAATLPEPSSDHITEGEIYLAYHHPNNTWQRCRVLTVDRRAPKYPAFRVYFIDLGGTCELSLDRLRLIPPSRAKSPYPLAMNCALANCIPSGNYWSKDHSVFIEKIINNKEAVIHIRGVNSTRSKYYEALNVDLMTSEGGINVAHALVFHGLAKLPNPNLKYPSIPSIAAKPTILINHKNFNYNSVEEVYITYIHSPDKFFVRKRQFMDTYAELCADLEREYKPNDNLDKIYLPEIGMACIVNVNDIQWLGDGVLWARGIVTELHENTRVSVALVDIGGEIVVHWSKLKRVCQKYIKCRAMATECYLYGITSLNKQWIPASVTLLQKYGKQLLELHVEDTWNPDSLGVVLYHQTDDGHKICINNEMIRQKFAVDVDMMKFRIDCHEEPQIVKTKPLDQLEKVAKMEKSESAKDIKNNNLEAIAKGPLWEEVKVTHYQSPSLIYVTLVHQQNRFGELFDRIQKRYMKKKENVSNLEWAIGDRCCSFCTQSQSWRRAIILDVQGDDAKVFYNDFGVTETVHVQSLRELTEEFAEVDDAASKCLLSGIVPSVGAEWPSLTKEYLKELLDSYKRLFINKVGESKDRGMLVEIWVRHTIPGGALEPDITEWQCLNKKIIEQGLAIPDKKQEATTSTTEITDAADGDNLPFLNVTGSVHDCLPLEPTPSVGEISASYDSTGLQPPEPFKCEEFIGIPVYISDDGAIFLHEVAQLKTLAVIRRALDLYSEQPDPKAKFVSWTVGEPCIALYSTDNRLYRGRVLEVDNKNETCLIKYVDYGNEDTCSFENLRKLTVLQEIPVQAHKCILDRIAPIGETWDSETLDYIQNTIVDKHCYIKITGDPIDDVTPIELKYDKLCINDNLVEFELAKYIDGTIPVVHKFARPVDVRFDLVPDHVK